MAKFAKLIELDNDEQVLLTVDLNDETEIFELTVRTEIDGMTLSIVPDFPKKKQAIDAMNAYTKQNAESFRKQLIDMMK